jgi:K+-sensing histidine kinase KdpD
MQTMSNKHVPQEDVPQREGTIHRRALARFPWLQSPAVGYVACVLLIGVLILIEKIDQYFPHAPLFVGTPFALASMLVAMIWGIGPAVFSIGLGLMVIVTFLVPGAFTPNVARDLLIAGPFVFVQLISVVTVVRLQRSHRQILAAQRVAEAYTHQLASANQQLIQANTQLERAQILKDYVLIRAAHELRTPLTTIRGHPTARFSSGEDRGNARKLGGGTPVSPRDGSTGTPSTSLN